MASQKVDSSLVSNDKKGIISTNKKIRFTHKILHQPNKVLFNSREFELEVFTDFSQKEIESVSLFYKIDDKPQFTEIPFNLNAFRYVYKYNPKIKPADQITYFFTIALKNGAFYATPIDETGNLKPITQRLVDPVEYYKQRAAYKK